MLCYQKCIQVQTSMKKNLQLYNQYGSYTVQLTLRGMRAREKLARAQGALEELRANQNHSRVEL